VVDACRVGGANLLAVWDDERTTEHATECECRSEVACSIDTNPTHQADARADESEKARGSRTRGRSS
jgi:hypothetical protein